MNPWPESVTEKQRAAVERAAQGVLDVRAEFLAPVANDVRRRTIEPTSKPDRLLTSAVTKTATLAMPTALQKAHEELDRAVDKCYRPELFTSERQRVEFLFARYEKLTAPLIAAAKPKRAPRVKSTPPKP